MSGPFTAISGNPTKTPRQPKTPHPAGQGRGAVAPAGRPGVKAGTTVTFTNGGDVQHAATAFERGNWDTGPLEKGQSKTVTFSEPVTYYYICTPHPWMYGQIIVE